MTTDPTPGQTERMAWVRKVRVLHRTKRLIGFAGIMLGASILLWWKFDAAAPEWALWTGIGVLLVSWALFIYVIVARYMWVKAHPYDGA